MVNFTLKPVVSIRAFAILQASLVFPLPVDVGGEVLCDIVGEVVCILHLQNRLENQGLQKISHLLSNTSATIGQKSLAGLSGSLGSSPCPTVDLYDLGQNLPHQ